MGHAVDSECACVYLYAMLRIVATRAMAAAAAPLLPPSPAAQLGNLQELVGAAVGWGQDSKESKRWEKEPTP